MALTPNVGSAFQATLQDNGNAIDFPAGTKVTWATEDATDVIETRGNNNEIAVITVTGDDPARTTLTATANATDPDGNPVTGSVTVDLTPGVTHTFTLSVAQVFPAPAGGGPSLAPSPRRGSGSAGGGSDAGASGAGPGSGASPSTQKR